MVQKLRAHVSGNVVAYLALFVALGGTSYAASLPRGSVGNVQLKTGAVTSTKVRDGSLQRGDFAAGALTGVRGVRGPEGPKGDSPALSGAAVSGQTLRGVWEIAAASEDSVAGDFATTSVSFGVELARAPVAHIVDGPPIAECPGNAGAPSAAAGHLCIYVGNSSNIGPIGTTNGLPTGGGLAARYGVGIVVANNASAPVSFGARGGWAVTAP